MLQIRLSKNPSSEVGGGAKPLLVDSVTVACPDHLVLADLPVAKGLGSATAASAIKTVGRRSRRKLGERVHFCVRCDFPIAIYGRLSPCEHAFCLDCARSDSLCYLCDERIQKIQTIKMMEGIFICAAPQCLKSFLKMSEFESHILYAHADLLYPNTEKKGNESEAGTAKKPAASDSIVQAAMRPVFSPSSNFQLQDREDKAHHLQHRDQSTSWPVMQPKPTQADNRIQGFDRPGPHNHFPPQNFESQGVPQQDFNQFPEKQQRILPESAFPEYPMHPFQPPNYIMPMNPILAPPGFNYPPYAPEGAQPFTVVRSEQGSLLGFPAGPTGGMNFSENYPRPWNNGPGGVPFEPSATGRMQDGFSGMPDSQGRAAFFQADYGQSSGVLPFLPLPQAPNKVTEQAQGIDAMHSSDGKGVLAQQPVQLPWPPPLHSPNMSQPKRGTFYTGGMGHEGQSYGWQPEKHDSFGTGQE